jgi:hypothetical protein
MTDFNLTTVTEDEIAALDTTALRTLATKALRSYDLRTTVASIALRSEVIEHAGALTVVDKLVQVLKAAYKGQDAQLHRQYGGSVEVTVWNEDEQLRGSLNYARRVAVKEAEAAEENTED